MDEDLDDARDCPPNDLSLVSFAERLSEIARGDSTLLKNLFLSVILINSTKRSVHLHVLKSDRNGRPQLKLLVSRLYNMIIDYCIPRKKIIEAYKYYNKTRLNSKVAALYNEAQSMFTDIANSGEGGELLLFILTESVLGYPQVFSKMAIKTSQRMHFHGLDGVYLSCVGSPPILRLHFAESKIHKSPAGSIEDATSSIAAMILDEGFRGCSKRDFFLLNNYLDLGDKELEDALLGFLNPSDPRFCSPEICAVLLAGHELADYPVVIEGEQLSGAMVREFNELIQILEKCAKRKQIEKFHIDLFIVPFPNIQNFRDELLREMGLL